MSALPQRLYRSDVEDTYLRKFVEEGEVFFRPLTYFRSLEYPICRDDHEGRYVKNADGSVLVADFAANGVFTHGLNIATGTIEFSTTAADHIHICCFSRTPQTKFGRSTTEVFDVPGLLNQISDTLALFKLDLKQGAVAYYDPTSLLVGELPDNVWLQKRKIYETENEFRISFVADIGKRFRHYLSHHFESSLERFAQAGY